MGERTRTATGGEHGGDHGNVAVGAHAVSGRAMPEALDHRPGRQGRESGVGGGDPTLERDSVSGRGGRRLMLAVSSAGAAPTGGTGA